MKNIGDSLRQQAYQGTLNYQEMVQMILADKDVADFIVKESLTPDEIEKSISKFHEYIGERNKYLAGDEAYIAKGYRPILIKNQGYADVSYAETPELVEHYRQEAVKQRLQLIHLPASLKNANFKAVILDDEGRLPVFEALTNIVVHYPASAKGLYLFGDFGVGKSYMMAALARELSEKKGASVTLLHYPSFVVEMKNAIGQGLVKEKLDEVKAAPVLIVDDIGAEQPSPWIRDDVLQVILQHRMQEDLLTLFTSNFSMLELEKHLSSGKTGDESWQAKRVMERIRYLAKEWHLKGENRRHE